MSMSPASDLVTHLTLMPVLFVPHGGGPLPLLNDPSHSELTDFLSSVSLELPHPKAILVVTAHWEEAQVNVSSAAAPAMLFDYYGFPPESYEFRYGAPGSPELAQRIKSLLDEEGIETQLNPRRDFDHGTFVPLMLMYPEAKIPVVQLSLLKSLEAEAHLALGEALAPLRKQGVLILGSGMSFHNMQAFFSENPAVKGKSELFDTWVTQLLTSSSVDYAAQRNGLLGWKEAPEALFCHPREEHLLPLLVCLGAAAATPLAEKAYSGYLFNTQISAFLWS